MNYWDKLMEDDDHAASYMATYGEGVGAATRLKLASYLKTEDWVLDVGCGPGWNYDTFLEYGPAVYYRGMDYSERFVRVASQRVHPMKIFKVGDVRDIPEPDGSFDVVILQDVLEHTNGYEKPLSEALRVARRRIIVTFWRLQDTPGHINDDGDDGWGAHYDSHDWEKFLDTLPVKWQHDVIEFNNKKRDFYVLDKEQA